MHISNGTAKIEPCRFVNFSKFDELMLNNVSANVGSSTLRRMGLTRIEQDAYVRCWEQLVVAVHPVLRCRTVIFHILVATEN